MAGTLRLKGATSGYVEFTAPDSGANTTVNAGLLIYKDSANGTITGTSTNDISEGSNLYYTTARFDSDFATKDLHDSVAVQAQIDATIASTDTHDSAKVQGQFDSAFPSAFDTRFALQDTHDSVAVQAQIDSAAVWSESGVDISYSLGNVGIGETSPEGILHLKTATGDANLIIEADPTNTDDADTPYITFRADGSSATSAMVGLAGGNDNFVSGVLANALVVRATGTRDTQFVNADSVSMTITDGGNVGIGTTAPANQLHIASSGADFATLRLDAPSNTVAATFQVRAHDGSFDIRDAQKTATRLTIDSDGSIGIGTTSPDAKLHVNGSFRQTGATAPFEWTVNPGASDYYKLDVVGYSNDVISVNSAGNVSIGTTAAGSPGLGVATGKNMGFVQANGESLANSFRQNTSGAYVLAQGYQYSSSTNGMASSFASSLARSAVWIGNGVRFYADPAATVSVGTDITPTERVRIDTDGLKFNGDTAAANALDDYEEGTVSLGLSDGTTTISGWTTGSYVKIGQMVTVHATGYNKNISSLGTAHLKITGLPFTSTSTASAPSMGIISCKNDGNIFSAIGAPFPETPTIMAEVSASSTQAFLYGRSTMTGANIDSLTKSDFFSASNASIWITITYRTS